MRGISLQRESLSADASPFFTFRSKLLRKIEEEGYTRNQVFKADETGLWRRLLPSKLSYTVEKGRLKISKNQKSKLTC